MPRWHTPLDPTCPQVEHAFQIPVTDDEGNTDWIDDPMGAPVIDELWEDFTKRHRENCTRCQTYGLDNIDVVS